VSELGEAARIHRSLAVRDGNNVQARCDTARIDEKLGDFTAASADACASWRTSLTTLEALRRSGIPCAAPDILERLQGKLRACR
jgi:hypothetical protein